jgi:hypothetical protein
MDGARGSAAGVSNSTNLKGYAVEGEFAACRISVPVGPLTGKLAHAVRASALSAKVTLRNMPFRRGTQEIDIE